MFLCPPSSKPIVNCNPRHSNVSPAAKMFSAIPKPRGEPQAKLPSIQFDGNPNATNHRHSTNQNGVKQRKRTKRGLAILGETTPLCPSLPCPLSELSGFEHIPLVDIESFVNRSVETRHAEVEERLKAKKSGITRPVNAFLLYRKCYLARIQAFCKNRSKNHETFSRIAGASWNKETGEFRERFQELSQIDDRKHQTAFPGWRYQPKQPVKAVRDDEDSELKYMGIFALESAYAPRSARPPSDAAQARIGYTPTSYATWQPNQPLSPIVQGDDDFDLGSGWLFEQMRQHGSSLLPSDHPLLPKDVAPPRMHHPKNSPVVDIITEEYEVAANEPPKSSTSFLPNSAGTNATTSVGDIDAALLYPELADIGLSFDAYTAFLLEIETYSRNAVEGLEPLPTY